ncbi:LptF/LptG family permease [Sulfurimonas sp. MAG313]|nr:LptF/LptG family permease [Sulfurimonas sp. MAG313]MDF1879761.1 LptF/LptG family permease [Sulfurimonas sp. MAG313]
MHKLKAYLLTNFSHLYFSIFMPLFVIASVIMLVKIAAFTSIIQLSLLEMLKLYTFMLPELLFYILPVTFFVSAVLAVSKLSNDNEMLVIFSLGIKPLTILNFFARLAFIQSLLLFLLFFLVTPYAKSLAGNFLKIKKNEAKFNIEASEYGHKFGEWLIFVGKNIDENKFADIILFNQKQKEETLLVANTAEIINKAGVLTLQLNLGKGFTYSKDSLSQMSFRKLYINDSAQTDTTTYVNTKQYWFNPDRREALKKQFIIGSLLSLFPLISVFLIPTIGIINVRHQKGHTYAYIFTSIILYYGVSFSLIKPIGLYTIAIMSIMSLLIVIPLYIQTIAKRY